MEPEPTGAPLALALVLTVAGCGTGGSGVPDPLPGSATEVEVQSVTRRSVYLDAGLAGEDFSGRLFFRAAPECERLLQPGAVVRYQRAGPWGEITGAGLRCVASGIAALDRWRDAQPTPLAVARPRNRAQYHIVFADDEYALARGRFPLATLLGWSAAGDAIAVIPRTEACEDPLDRGVASMEFRARGPHALVLISARGACPITGLIAPQPGLGAERR